MADEAPPTAEQQANAAAARAWESAEALERMTALLSQHYASLVRNGTPDMYAFWLTQQWYAHLLAGMGR